jgi:hypothetical protein
VAEIDGRVIWTVQMASAFTGAKEHTIRKAVRRGDIELVGLGERGGGHGGGRRRWLIAAADVLAWHRASRLPRLIPADPLRLALDGSLRLALDLDLALRAFERLEAERRRLGAERLALQEAR